MSALRLERAIGLDVIQLPRRDAGHEHAPDVAPAVHFGVEVDDVRRFEIVDRVVEQHPHGGGRAAEHGKLHPALAYIRAIGQRLRELPGRKGRVHRGQSESGKDEV